MEEEPETGTAVGTVTATAATGSGGGGVELLGDSDTSFTLARKTPIFVLE